MSGPSLVINGWTLFAHPLFLDAVEALFAEVEAQRQKDPTGYNRRNAAKRLAAITKLAFEVIPQDPTRPDYRQGNTLGDAHRHWFRAKFFQQYRLFFRYHADARIIVYAWVNDDDTKRACESADDAYRVFRRMLDRGHPPDNWEQLLAEARADAQRLTESALSRSRLAGSGLIPPDRRCAGFSADREVLRHDFGRLMSDNIAPCSN